MSEQPKYLMVADTLRKEIAEGVFQDGQKLMTEETLRDRFQVSRQTVRQALSLLESERLIERRQGSGSHIREQKEPDPMPRRSIAVVTTYISDYIFPSILREIEAVCSENNSLQFGWLQPASTWGIKPGIVLGLQHLSLPRVPDVFVTTDLV